MGSECNNEKNSGKKSEKMRIIIECEISGDEWIIRENKGLLVNRDLYWSNINHCFSCVECT